MTVLFLHQFEHCDCHSNDADANCGLGNGREFTRMQTRQWLPGLFALGDFFRIDRADVKINRGIEWSGRLYSEKSSPPMVGSTMSTFSLPNDFFHTATRRFVNSGLL